MAFKFIALFASVAVAVHAASIWPSQPNQWQDQRIIQQGRSDAPWTVSQTWNDNGDRQWDSQELRRVEDQQNQWRRVQNQDQWRDQWNRNQWENDNNNRNDWNRDNARQQWPQQQQQNWERKFDNDQENWDHHPRYEFAYEVRDPRSGDFKAHQESRDGDFVRGQYSLVEPDGSRRIVDYTSDSNSGFNANVRKEGWSRH